MTGQGKHPLHRNRLPALLVLLILLSGCSANMPGFMNPQGPVAEAQRHHFWVIIALVMIVVIPVIIQTPLILWRYRYRGHAVYRPKWYMSRWLDIIMWAVPILIVAILGSYIWRQTHELDPYRPIAGDQPPLEIQVVGYDWKWLFIYPDQGIATMGQLVVPVNRPISFELTSATVLQSFFIPALGSQIDVMNRMVTRLHLKADHPGRFEGKNMQYNGEGFHRQRFVTRAVDGDAFDDFVKRTRQLGQPLDQSVYRIIAQKGDNRDVARTLGLDTDDSDAVIRFSTVPDGLFHTIMTGSPIDWSAMTIPPPQQGTTRTSVIGAPSDHDTASSSDHPSSSHERKEAQP
ncbi:Cytochrome bo(3) ubiquinol oxidase subunit 2 [Kushneria phyllosphaerae]|uniref:Cytochrome bo(3) ubiquinol oxidase subunit 2 n=2 Tax=Kushneria phyllosphaerae TaxID=2100822 RepID=A0A2R8CLU3_9GAMM|nr:Cytochrome bo(3) ubiquinol oxidase subunit 2 [Kushneria phyllosphaerae]